LGSSLPSTSLGTTTGGGAGSPTGEPAEAEAEGTTPGARAIVGPRLVRKKAAIHASGSGTPFTEKALMVGPASFTRGSTGSSVPGDTPLNPPYRPIRLDPFNLDIGCIFFEKSGSVYLG